MIEIYCHLYFRENKKKQKEGKGFFPYARRNGQPGGEDNRHVLIMILKFVGARVLRTTCVYKFYQQTIKAEAFVLLKKFAAAYLPCRPADDTRDTTRKRNSKGNHMRLASSSWKPALATDTISSSKYTRYSIPWSCKLGDIILVRL